MDGAVVCDAAADCERGMTVSIDSAALVYCPASSTEWAELLSGTGLNGPSSCWACSESSGTLADSIGSRTLTSSGGGALSYQQSAPGWSRKGVAFADNGTGYLLGTGADTTTTSGMLLQVLVPVTNPASGFRALNCFGNTKYEEAQFVNGATGAKLRGQSDSNTATGDQQHAGGLVVVTKYDHTNGVFSVQTRGERIKPTYVSQTAGSATNLFLLGDGINSTDAIMVYAAYWTGADAEITDAQIQTLIDAVYGDATTLSKMQAGSFASKWVATIEGCQYALSDAPEPAVQTAYAGTDWANATTLGGLYVECKNSQHITPWDPFVTGGTCTLRVVPDADDTFGVLVNRRAAGAETEITATLDRDDTTINVASTAEFDSSGTVYIGTEAISYTGKTGTTFTGCTRGLYSPLTAGTSGSGGNRFANHHRLGFDPYHVQMRPIVSEQPRVWIGKRVAVRLHTWDAVNQTLNSRDEAQLMFAGRIAGIADDPNDFSTVLDIEPITEEIRNGILGKDMWKAALTDGLDLVEGRVFLMQDWRDGTAIAAANDLVVVASGASTTNEVNAGRYSLNEVCDILSRWLGGERAAGRIAGFYVWHSPVTFNAGMRTTCVWSIANGGTVTVEFDLTMPAEVAMFLGLKGAAVQQGQSIMFRQRGISNTEYIAQGDDVPFQNLVFKPNGPGRLAQEFTLVTTYPAEDEQGIFIDQYEYLPASIKLSCDSSKQWGLFLLDEKFLMVGSYDSGVLSNCWLAPFQLTADTSEEADKFIGRRVDEAEGGQITLRQVLILEGTFAEMLATFIYGTGTSGYNHADYDTLGYGLGIGIPGEVLGGSFDQRLASLPGANAPIAVIIDEPTKFVDLFSADLVLRRCFIRWKDEAFEFSQWKTPLAANAVAALPESTKAAPAGHVENHRIASLESTEHARPIVKLDYCRDFAAGRDGLYLKSVMVEDQTAVDDLGGNVKPYTIKLRNTYGNMSNAGSAIEALLPDFITMMPVLGRPFRVITRSIDSRFFEGYSVGDIMTVTDSFARDPLTGQRGIESRAAMIARIAGDIGGPNPDGGDPRPAGGEVDLFFLDTHRGEVYCPSAQVDDTATNAGYDNATKTLTCYAQKFSHTVTKTVRWGAGTRTFDFPEAADATHFVAGDKVLIIEIDPANPASPDYWERTVDSQTGNTIVLTTTLSSPAWSSSKKYRITYQKFSQVQDGQLEHVYQADSTDKLVEDSEVAWHYSATEEAEGFTAVSGL